MEYKKITILAMGAIFLLLCSLSTISAANQTITPGDTGGISQGINNTGTGDTLFLQPGTYNKTGQDTNITISKNITIQGNGSTNSVIIDAQGLSRIFTINSSLNVTFINITFINGDGSNTGGSAIYSSARNLLTITNCTFKDNHVGTGGGALYLTQNTVIITNCTFENNIALNATAGTGNAGGIQSTNSNLTVIGAVFTDNRAGSDGAAIFSAPGAYGNASIINCTFTGNVGDRNGGAVRSSGNLTITGCTFTNNNATGKTPYLAGLNGTGGAISHNSGNLTVTGCIFTNNNAMNGGAIYFYSTTNGTVINSTFISNSATDNGGGILNAGNMSVSGNIMGGNVAGILGNVIYNNGTMGVLNLTYLGNSTLKVQNNTQVVVYATLTDDMGNPVTGGNITIYINNTLIATITSIEGQASIIYTPTHLGIIPLTGDYSSNGEYTININPGQLEIVLKFDTGSTINVPGNVKVGKTINITGVATDEFGNPLNNVKLNVTVDGKTYTVTTDNNGRWVLPYKPTHTGNVIASVSWAGNDTYNGFTNSTDFNVKKGNIIVTITVTENDDGSITITANATDEDGDPVSDHPVDFFLDDELVGSESTDKNGIASITIPASKISDGPHTITVIVNGGDNFNNGIVSIEFTKTPENNDTTNTTNKTNKTPTAEASMKETGVPIVAVLLALLVSIGLVTRKK